MNLNVCYTYTYIGIPTKAYENCIVLLQTFYVVRIGILVNQTSIIIIIFFFMTLHLLQYVITFFDKPLTQIRPALFYSGRGDIFLLLFLISLVTCALTHPAAPVGAPFKTNKTKHIVEKNIF